MGFCNSINNVRRLTSVFTLLEMNPFPLHAQMHQKQRLKHLEKFSSQDNSLLIATDVAARGLDIPNVVNVVHFQIPRTSENYVHRSGRTARASRNGLSLMLIEPGEAGLYRQLCHTLKKDKKDLPDYDIDMKTLSAVKQRVNLAPPSKHWSTAPNGKDPTKTGLRKWLKKPTSWLMTMDMTPTMIPLTSWPKSPTN